MDCIVCDGPLGGRAVRVDQYTCTNHLLHEECMERRGRAWRNPPEGPKRNGFECPACKATATTYVAATGENLDKNLRWIPITKEEMNASDPEIPAGAVSAGFESGLEVFVARGRVRGDLVPGKWIPWTRVSFFPWGGHEHRLQECEVLTFNSESTEPEVEEEGQETTGAKLKWVKASADEIHPNAVLAGWTAYGEGLYIGRTKFGKDDDVICGKVHPSHKVLYVPYSGKELNKSQYEILVYQPAEKPAEAEVEAQGQEEPTQTDQQTDSEQKGEEKEEQS